MSIFDILTPGAVAQDPHDRWRWATVTSTTPLTVRFDGDTTPVHPTSVLVNVPALVVGNRVWCQLFGQRIIVLGVGGGQAGGGGGLSVASITIRKTRFTVNGNYVPDPNLLSAFIEAVGAGGGGGGAGAAAGSSNAKAGGGGGGEYATVWMTAAEIGTAPVPVTVGTGGPGGAATPTAGTAGGDSSFGAFLIADSGKGGTLGNSTTSGFTSITGGEGGGYTAPGGGTAPNIISHPGQPGITATGGTSFANSGAGGSAGDGSGGARGRTSNSSGTISPGTDATGRGGGGSGGMTNGGAGAGAAGGDGAPGEVTITEYISTAMPPPELSAAYPATPNTLALRNGNGNTQVAWPVADEDAVPKSYVDSIARDSGLITSGIITPAANWVVDLQSVRRFGPVCTLHLTLTYNGPTIVAGPTGNITNVTVGTVAAEYQPTGQSIAMPSGSSGGASHWGLNQSGEVVLAAVVPNLSIGAGTTWSMSATYMTDEAAIVTSPSVWTPLLLHANVVPFAPGTEPRYKRTGTTVTLSGVVKPANAAAANALQTVGGMTIAFLPPEITPDGDPLALFGSQKGPNNNSWFTSVQGANTFTASRYGPNNPDTSTWLPFSLTYLL